MYKYVFILFLLLSFGCGDKCDELVYSYGTCDEYLNTRLKGGTIKGTLTICGLNSNGTRQDGVAIISTDVVDDELYLHLQSEEVDFDSLIFVKYNCYYTNFEGNCSIETKIDLEDSSLEGPAIEGGNFRLYFDYGCDESASFKGRIVD